ncbi:hypothetical protein ACM26V_20840 [Salipaludibacillus sp. HK11]|uniref:hypothetical protein n=1 Tax=Salipaludibacillus sp. HK11 TaxID=3394320 RepID=UPI0039FBB326
MSSLTKMTVFGFIVCIVIGVGLSFVIGKGEQTYQSLEEGDIGYLVHQDEMGSSPFDRAFDTTFKIRVQVTAPEKIKNITSFINIYEYGEHIAEYRLGGMHYDDEFSFYSGAIDFALGGMRNTDEDEEGYYWTHVIQAEEGSLRSTMDMLDEGELKGYVEMKDGPVNDGELVMNGVGVIEGPNAMQSFSGDRDEFYQWAENYERVFAYEILFSSEEIDIEPGEK